MPDLARSNQKGLSQFLFPLSVISVISDVPFQHSLTFNSETTNVKFNRSKSFRNISNFFHQHSSLREKPKKNKPLTDHNPTNKKITINKTKKKIIRLPSTQSNQHTTCSGILNIAYIPESIQKFERANEAIYPQSRFNNGPFVRSASTSFTEMPKASHRLSATIQF